MNDNDRYFSFLDQLYKVTDITQLTEGSLGLDRISIKANVIKREDTVDTIIAKLLEEIHNEKFEVDSDHGHFEWNDKLYTITGVSSSWEGDGYYNEFRATAKKEDEC